MSLLFLLLPLLLLLSSSSSSSSCFVRGDIYDLETTQVQQLAPIVRRVVAMYATDDAPMAFAASTDDDNQRLSYIELQLTFNASYLAVHTNDQQQLRFVEVMHLAATNLNDLGVRKNGTIQYCCTKDNINEEGCAVVGRLAIRANTSRYHSILVEFPPVPPSPSINPTLVTLNRTNSHFPVTHTSEHLMVIGYCSSLLGPHIEVSGIGYWKNAYGWLPGRLYGFLPFYGYMLIGYAFVTCMWCVLYCRHRSEIAPVQQLISSVLLLSTTEMASGFGDYYSFNVVGRRHVGMVTLSILLTVSRLALSRVLVVAVSLGYGVTIPRLGSTKWKLLILGLLYWCFELSLELVTRYAQTHTLAEEWRIGLSLPVAVLNALFYWWIFIALQNTMEQLKHDQQIHKLTIYRQFTAVLIFSLIAAVIFAFYQIYFMTTHQFPLHWSYLWLLDGGFSSFLYSLILLMIMMMWRPTEDSHKYAYSELPLQQLDDDNEMDDNDEFGDLELTSFDQPDHPNSERGNVNAPDTPNDDDDDRHSKSNSKSASNFTLDE